MKKLIRNRAKCLKCGDMIESVQVHQMVQCSCRNIYVDGGLDYCHHGWEDEKYYLNLSEYEGGRILMYFNKMKERKDDFELGHYLGSERVFFFLIELFEYVDDEIFTKEDIFKWIGLTQQEWAVVSESFEELKDCSFDFEVGYKAGVERVFHFLNDIFQTEETITEEELIKKLNKMEREWKICCGFGIAEDEELKSIEEENE